MGFCHVYVALGVLLPGHDALSLCLTLISGEQVWAFFVEGEKGQPRIEP